MNLKHKTNCKNQKKVSLLLFACIFILLLSQSKCFELFRSLQNKNSLKKHFNRMIESFNSIEASDGLLKSGKFKIL